jgi:hypothetical protein
MTDQEIEQIVKNHIKSNGYGFDPLTILTIISVCIQLYKLIKECKAAKSILQRAARRQGLAYKVFVKNNFINKLSELGVPENDALAILEELRVSFINS